MQNYEIIRISRVLVSFKIYLIQIKKNINKYFCRIFLCKWNDVLNEKKNELLIVIVRHDL